MPPPQTAQLRMLEGGAASRPSGSDDPWNALFRTHARYVGRVAARLLGRDDEIDDVIQDVFVRAHRSLREQESAAQVRSWFAVTTVRVVRTRLRRRRLRAFLGFDGAMDAGEVPAAGVSGEDRALLREVYAALDEVPADCRIAWLLRHVEGEGLETIGMVCGCSLATVKRRIGVAERMLEGRLR